MNGAEISNYAGRFADEAVQILDVEGVHKSVVMVTQGYATGYPLSIGTPRNSGFGMEDEIYGDTYNPLFFRKTTKSNDIASSSFCALHG